MGGQKSFVVAMLLLEAVVVGLVFGSLGALAGAALVRFAGAVGIPAVSEELYFFFSGPRFYPSSSSMNVVIAFGVVLIVSCSRASTRPGSPRRSPRSRPCRSTD